MSLKNIKEYYDKVYFDYREAVGIFNEFSIVAQDTLVTPDEVEEKKKILEPIEKNYQTISYFMFLIGKGINQVKKYYDRLYMLNEQTQSDFIEFEEYALSSGNIDAQTLMNRREYALSSQNNFEEFAWLVYLLNLPNKKKKRKRYVQLNEKKVSRLGLDTRYDHKLEENRKYLDELKKK